MSLLADYTSPINEINSGMTNNTFFFFAVLGVDLLKAFVATVRRSPARYSGVDADPEVTYERMPHIHFAIDGT